MKNLIKVFSFICILTILTSCHKDPPAPPIYTDQGNIGALGGIIKTNDGASVEIPSGALSESRAISISNTTPGDTIPNTGYSVYELKPDGLKFNDSIIITFPFDNTYVDLNSNEENYGIYIAVIKDTIVTKLKTKIDIVNKIAKVKTTHFSNYYIFSPSSWSTYYKNNKSGPSNIMPVPYYGQVGNWCFYASLSMIVKYAGYPYKAPNLASLFEEGDPETKGFRMIDYVFIKRLKISLAMSYEYSTFWTNYENMYGYILNRLNSGLPVLIMSTKLGHAIVVTGHDQTGFYVNNPKDIPIMNHYTYDYFKDWIGISVLKYCNTLCITSNNNRSNAGLTLNFFDELYLSIKDNQAINTIGGLKISGKFSPSGYTIIDNMSNLTGNFDGSDYLTVQPIIANSYPETKLVKLHAKIDNKDIKGSPQHISLTRRNDNLEYDPIITQLSNLPQGKHVISVELRSTDSQTLYDSWDFSLNIAKIFIDNGKPPNPPSIPSPSNGATGILTSTTLSWTCTDPEGDPLTYDVYFGTSNNPSIQIGTNLTSESIIRTGLGQGVTYYWKVVAKDNRTNSTNSPIWSFRTAQAVDNPPAIPSGPNPANGAIGVSTSSTLGWSCSDPDGDALTFDVYFGTTSNPTTTIATNQTATSIARSGLSNSTTYYWKIVAKDSKGATTPGPVWSFTTQPLTPTSYEAKNSASAPLIDGQINTSEWANANSYAVTFTRSDGYDTKNGTLYLQHDGTWIYVGVKTNNAAGWDVYLALRFDGNNDHILNGQDVEPHTDINIAYPSPDGWPGYIRYDYVVTPGGGPTTPPDGTLSASYGSETVDYEFKIKISDLNTSTGNTVGFYIFNLVDADPSHGYEFPINSAVNNPTNWEHIKLQ